MFRLGLGAALLALLLLAAELALPRLAERRLREDLAATGEVLRVSVSAFPALKLLFGRADRVEVELGALEVANQGRVADLVARTDAAGELDVRVQELRVGPLLVRDVRMDKTGDLLTGEAAVTQTDLAAALPVAIGLRPLSAEDGQLVLEATAPVFGRQVSVRARLSAREGALVIAAEGLLAGFGTLTVFRDPRVQVDGIGARGRPDGFTVTAEGQLTG